MGTFITIPISRTHTPHRSLERTREQEETRERGFLFLKGWFLLFVIMYEESMHTYIQVLMKTFQGLGCPEAIHNLLWVLGTKPQPLAEEGWVLTIEPSPQPQGEYLFLFSIRIEPRTSRLRDKNRPPPALFIFRGRFSERFPCSWLSLTSLGL